MSGRAQVQFLPDGRRLHLHDGPIDIVLEAFGHKYEVAKAYRAASMRFEHILDELCAELALLRQPARIGGNGLRGPAARRMESAVLPYAERTFITPMAAVAGAVAEEVLDAMVSSTDLERAYVNDGGDIALHLEGGTRFVVGMVDRPDRPSLLGSAIIEWSQPVRGIATSGWRGRSFSLGIADAVTVLADTAAMADAAATIIANAVDLPGHPHVERVKACELAPDSDLGELFVTQGVGELTPHEINTALDSGAATAHQLIAEGLIRAVALHLHGMTRTTGLPLLSTTLESQYHDGSLIHA